LIPGLGSLPKWRGETTEVSIMLRSSAAPPCGIVLSILLLAVPTSTSAQLSLISGGQGASDRTAIAIGADGLGLIGFYDRSSGTLKVAHCDDSPCSSATVSTIDTVGISGFGSGGPAPAIAIGSDGRGLVTYTSSTNYPPTFRLKVAHCNDVACTSANVVDLDAADPSGAATSVTVGTDGLGLISYGVPHINLKVAHCNTLDCSSATLSTIDATESVAGTSAITIGQDGRGLIAYNDATNGRLRVAHCNDLACTSASLSTVDGSGSPSHADIAIGADGLGLISYQHPVGNHVLRVAHCNDIICSSSTVTTVDGNNLRGGSVAIGTDGLGIISYYASTPDDLKVAHCLDVACTSSTNLTLDEGGSTGAGSAIAIGADGFGLISYIDGFHVGALKVAHCTNTQCTSVEPQPTPTPTPTPSPTPTETAAPTPSPTATATPSPSPTSAPTPTPTPTSSPSPAPTAPGTCGNGIVEPAEQCDLGPRNGDSGSSCTTSCRLLGRCTGSQVACSAAADCPSGQGCCGNTVLEPGEACEDGNLLAGDCCSAACQSESSADCAPSLCSELGFFGQHVLSMTEKLTLSDAKADGKMERWTKSGDFNLFSGQTINPSGEAVTVAISENDGGNGRVELHRVTIEPDDCPPASSCFVAKQAGKAWRYKDARKVSDPPGSCGLEIATLRSTSGNKIKLQLRGKADAADGCAYEFPRPAGTVLREDIVIGDVCATVLLDCRVFGGNRSYKCVPRP